MVRRVLPALLFTAWAWGADRSEPSSSASAQALLEVPAASRPPAWVERSSPPLFRFAWLSDLHLNARNREATAEALRYVRADVAPVCVVITGDNCGLTPPNRNGVSRRRARQEVFRAFLNEHLGLPAEILPGDNWPWAFAEVFGPFQRAFLFGGLQFVFLAPDRSAPKAEGCAVFDDRTLAWLDARLQATAEHPTLVFLHEPVAPPAFLDADRCLRILSKHDHVLATCAGHLHLDLEVTLAGRTHLCCPALGPSPRHGFKELYVYPDMIVLRTHERRDGTGPYEIVPKWQRIRIPPRLGTSLHRPAAGFAPTRREAVPAHARREDPSLAERRLELAASLSLFLLRQGVQAFGEQGDGIPSSSDRDDAGASAPGGAGAKAGNGEQER